MFEYTITKQDGRARTGQLVTPHGVVETPVFMPVGTHGAVKGVSPAELITIGSQIVLSNTYHLYLRPGEGIVASTGGLHGFTQYNGPMLTDSGGFQVFSLGEKGMDGREKNALRTVSEEGITFSSHLDGSKHLFTPEKSIEIQQKLGADIIMAFDQPVYGLSDPATAKDAVDRTHRWLDRSITRWKTGDTSRQALFGIVQGGINRELHTMSANFVVSKDLPGNAIGGLSVGEGKDEMWEATDSICTLLPENKPRYFMGLGEPRDLIHASLLGVDMYDCVAPSRLARHGTVWMPAGEGSAAFWSGDTEELLSTGTAIERLNLINAQFREDITPLSPVKTTLPADLQGFTRATINHYLKENEMLGYRILTLHNIAVLHQVTVHLRNAIKLGRSSELLSAIK